MWQLCAAMMSWVGCLLFRFRATRYMKVKRMGITEILKRIWLFSANKKKLWICISKQLTRHIFEFVILFYLLSHFTCNSTINATLYRDWLQEMKFDTCSEKIISQISSINCHTKRWHNGVKHICRRISITYIPNIPLRNNASKMWTNPLLI